MKRSSFFVVEEELFQAVKKGNLRNLQGLVQDWNADIHVPFDKFPHDTVMHLAAFHGHQHLLPFLLSKGLDVNVTDEAGNVPLHLASQAGHAEVVQFLLDQNANMHAVNMFKRKPVHMAAMTGKNDVVQIFLEKGMDVEDADFKGSTLLHLSCSKRKLKLVQLVANYKADIHAKDNYGQKPIHFAAQRGCQDIVQFFLNSGMSVNEMPDDGGNTLLHFAGGFDLDFVQFLVDNNADIHAKATNGRKPIHAAAARGRKDIVEYFLDLGMSIEETDKNGQTLLHLAAKKRRLEVVQLLIDRIGANPQLDAQDNKGKTPLHLVQFFEKNIMTCLLDAGARSDIKDHDGRTVMFYFMSVNCIPEDLPIVAKMHNFVDIDDQTKMTAAHLVVQKRLATEVIKLVLQNKEDLNIEDKNGYTPMNYLTGNAPMSGIDNKETLIRMFVDHGACFKAVDCERIVQNPSLKERLFTDKKFCSQYLVNKFDNVDLPMLERLPSAISPSVLEKMKLRSSQIGLIESAVEEEIRNKGHCDFSKMISPLLSMLAIGSYISHYRT